MRHGSSIPSYARHKGRVAAEVRIGFCLGASIAFKAIAGRRRGLAGVVKPDLAIKRTMPRTIAFLMRSCRPSIDVLLR
jgi:hypothetical protein